MGRISFYEKLKQKKVSFSDEIKKICTILIDSSTFTESFFSTAFKKSPFNTESIDFNSSLYQLIKFKPNDIDLHRQNDLSNIIYYLNDYKKNIKLDSFLDVLEFFKTIFYYGEKQDINDDVRQIMAIVDDKCNRLGYDFHFNEKEKYYSVILKNPEAEAVATSVNETTGDKIYNYLTCRNGDIKNKRLVLKSLSDDIESIVKKYHNISDFDKVKEFIQCIRHTKETNNLQKKFGFYYENEEEWLDKSFEMMIGVLAFKTLKIHVKEIKELQQKSENI